MKTNCTWYTRCRACFALVLFLGVIACIVPAQALAADVSGNDSYYYSESSEGEELADSVEILTVTGQAGETVYIKLTNGQAVLADHLAFTLSDDAEADDNGSLVAKVSVEFNAVGFDPHTTYDIMVYPDRDEQEDPLYTGTVSTVWARFGSEEPVSLAVRTIGTSAKYGEEVRPFAAPNSLMHNSVTYVLGDDQPVESEGVQVYEYAAPEGSELADSVEGHITYYDIAQPTGDAIQTDTITLEKDKPVKQSIESIIASKDGRIYRTLQLAGTVTLSYPGTTEYSVMCKELNAADWGTNGQSFFKATITYVDEAGESLGIVDSVVVNKEYIYTAPTNIFVKDDDGMVRAYTIVSDPVLTLKPGMAQEPSTFTYKPLEDTAERTWTVVVENGSVAPTDPKRIITDACVTYHGAPGTSQTHTTAQSIDVDGVTYVPTASAKESYEHTFTIADMDVEQVIYYVPDGYEAPEAYDVTVKYVNIADNQVIDTQTVTASPGMREDLEITSPESFSQNGIEWIRLNGQEMAIRHSFYSGVREYVVYYRDINDDLHAKTVIRTVRVVYVDAEGNTVSRPTIVTDNGTTTTPGGTTTTGAQGTNATATEGGAEGGAEGTADAGGAEGTQGAQTAGGTATGLPTGEDLLAVDGTNGDDGTDLVTQDGTDLATRRIDDDATPLAGPGEQSASMANGNGIAIAGVSIGAIAALFFLFFFIKRRKSGTDESSHDDQTA